MGLRSIRGDASSKATVLRSLLHAAAGDTPMASALRRAAALASCGGVASPTNVEEGLASPWDFASWSRRRSKARAECTSGVQAAHAGVHSPSYLHSTFAEMGVVGMKGFPSASHCTVKSRRKPERRCESAEGGDFGERSPPDFSAAAPGDSIVAARVCGSVSQVKVKAWAKPGRRCESFGAMASVGVSEDIVC